MLFYCLSLKQSFSFTNFIKRILLQSINIEYITKLKAYWNFFNINYVFIFKHLERSKYLFLLMNYVTI